MKQALHLWATLATMACTVATASGQATAPTSRDEDTDDTIVLSPFEVRSEKQLGYRAANTVTASRFALPIIDTPMSIAVVTEEFTRDIGARDALESLSYVSGINQQGAIRLEGSTSFNIRGASTGFNLRNGVTSYGINDGYNIERWEVLKGIVGMMYGDRNLGGVINAVSAQPRDTFGGEVFFRTDEYGSTRYQGRVTGPVTKDKKLLYMVNVLKKDEETFMDYEQLRAEAITGSIIYRPFTGTRIFAEYELYNQNNVLPSKLPPLQNAAGPRYDNDLDWWQRVGFAPVPLEFNYAGPDSYLDERNRLLTLTLDQRLLDWLNFRSNFVYMEREQNRLNRDAGPTYVDVAPGRARNYFDWATGTFKTETAADAPFIINGMNSNLREFANWNTLWRNDLLANYNFIGGKHRTLVGFEYQERSGRFHAFDSMGAVTLDARNPFAAAIRAVDSRGRVNTDIRTFDPTLPQPGREEFLARVASDPNDQFGNFNGSTNETKATYVVHYSQFFNDRLTLFGGVRRDEDRNKSNWRREDYNLTRPNGNPRPNPYAPRVYGTPTDWVGRNSPQVGVAYRLLPELSMYATWADVLVSTNFIQQIVQEADGSWSRGEFVDMPPRTGINKEVGFKSEFFDGRLSGTLAFFRTDLENVPFTVSRDDPSNITRDPNAPAGSLAPLAYTTLAGLERRQGVELDFVYNVNNQLRFLGSYAYTDAKVVKDSAVRTDATSPTGATPPQTLKRNEGLQAGGVPEHQARLWTSYSFPHDEGFLHTANVGFGIRYYGGAQPNTDNYRGTTILDTTLLDLSLSRTVEVFNRDIRVTVRAQNLLDERYWAATQIYGEPRTFVLELRHSF